MRVLTVVGARPQFVKAAVLSREFRARGVDETLVHTGQHYESSMSDVFFTELSIPEPSHHLGVGSASHAAQTAEMMRLLEPIVASAALDWVVIYGDTNSTLAGALVASKLHVPLAHVEAGLRSFDRTMPEEINRIVADRVCDLLLAPTENAAANLRREGADVPIEIVGDVMVDLALQSARTLPERPAILERFALHSCGFALVTIHRAANTDDPAVFSDLIAALRALKQPVLFPVHPRTRALAARLRVGDGDGIIACEPLSYLDMLALQRHARVVLTDSGGMQKEAVMLGTPCVTLRDRTEWVETLEAGWNILAGHDPAAIVAAAKRPAPSRAIAPFGDGSSARQIVDALFARASRTLAEPVSCAS